MPKSRTRRVVMQPAASQGMRSGIDQIVAPIRLTLGPRPRLIAVASSFNGSPPELLDDGGVIARRIVELPNHDADMGAMLVRHLLWRLHETTGDGTATAAVLFQAVYDLGLRFIAAGGNAILLRHHLEEGLQLITEQLATMVIYPEGEETLVRLAESICHDPPLAKLLGEIFDVIGAYGQLDIRSGYGREMRHEYIAGAYWSGGIFSPEMITGQEAGTAVLTDAAIIISDLEIKDIYQLVPVIEAAMRTGFRSLVIVAGQLSDTVTGFLVTNGRQGWFRATAVKAPGQYTDRAGMLKDISTLTGGRVFLTATGDTLAAIKPEEFGQARRVWADKDFFGIAGGKGDPRILRQHLAALQAAFAQAADQIQRAGLQERIGKLLGGSATLWVGDSTESEAKMRKELAERTARTVRGAIREGMLPGGGASLLACQPALRKRLARDGDDVERRAAYNILIKAMEVPARTIFCNAGFDPNEIMAKIQHAGTGRSFDVVSGRVVDMAKAGVFDSAAAYKAAVQGAVSTAALALTTDVLIHSKKSQQVLDPG